MPGKESRHAIRLSVFRINRSCKPANPAFTCQKNRGNRQAVGGLPVSILCFRRISEFISDYQRLAGLPSRSSRQPARLRPAGYGAAAFSRFASEGWWSRSGSNRRPQACKARALPTELRPRARFARGNQNSEVGTTLPTSDFRRRKAAAGGPGTS